MTRNGALQTEVQTLVESFTDELKTLVKRLALEQVASALGGDNGTGVSPRATNGRRTSGTRLGRGVARRGGSSADADRTAERVAAYIKKNPGQRGDQIAKGLGTDVATLRSSTKRLIAAKTIKTHGQRRGMTYHPATGAGRSTRSASNPSTAREKRGTKGRRPGRRARR